MKTLKTFCTALCNAFSLTALALALCFFLLAATSCSSGKHVCHKKAYHYGSGQAFNYKRF